MGAEGDMTVQKVGGYLGMGAFNNTGNTTGKIQKLSDVSLFFDKFVANLISPEGEGNCAIQHTSKK